VIGAGLGRTGTKSLKDALERLGFVKCHHMVEVHAQPERFHHWEEALARGVTDWDALFQGYAAAVDYPAAAYWPELAAYYPDAKVILTVRDADDWYDSAAATIHATSARPPDEADPARARFLRWARGLVWEGQFQGRFTDRSFAIEAFHRHNATVRATIPADRLLVYETGSGWEPLVRFLGVPTPEQSYPHVNTRDEFRARFQSAGPSAGR
jgi:hypothetical protein